MYKNIFFLITLAISGLTQAQVINLACKTSEGSHWGTLQIDLKRKTIIDINELQKASFNHLSKWKEKYYQEQGKDYKPEQYDPIKESIKYNIDEQPDQVIRGSNTSLAGTKFIEINRYTLRMHYPPNNKDGWTFNCTKIEKAF